MGIVGMNVQLIQEMSAGMEREAQELSSAMASLAAAMARVPWSGPDADRFRAEWEGQQRQISQTIADLRRVAQVARDHAQRQDQTSRTL